MIKQAWLVMLLAFVVPACGGSSDPATAESPQQNTTILSTTAPLSANDHSAAGIAFSWTSNSGLAPLPLELTHYDTDAFWDGSTKYVVKPGLGGKYHMDATVVFSPGCGYALTGFRFNGVGIFCLSQHPNSQTDGVILQISQDHLLLDGDYIEVVSRHSNGSALNVRLNNFNLHKLY